MNSEIQRRILLEQRRVSEGSHPWSLKEIGLDDTRYIERWVPSRGSYYFTASSIALSTSLSTDSAEKASGQNYLDEIIGARLYPGIVKQGSLQNKYRFSTFGTNHTVEMFQFYLKADKGDETADKCFIRYLGDQDQAWVEGINFEIHLSLPVERFNIFRQMIMGKAVDTFELILSGVSGFYKDEFSIGEARKLLTNDVRKTITTEGDNNGNQEFNPEDTGKVQEWDITLEHQLALEKLAKFSETVFSRSPSVGTSYIQQSVKPYLKGLQKTDDQLRLRSGLDSVIERTAKNVAKYSNSVDEGLSNYKTRLADAIDVVKSIHSAINTDPSSYTPTENENSKEQEIDQSYSEQTLWNHGNLHAAFQEGYESTHYKKVNKEILEHEAVRYLQRPWMWDDHLEWVMIDALMFCEAIEFGEYIKQNLPGHTNSLGLNAAYFSAKGNLKKMARARQKKHIMKTAREFLFFVILPVSLGFYFWDSKHQDIVFWGLAFYILSFALYVSTKFLAGSDHNDLDANHDERNSLLLKMRSVYAELDTGVINPSYLRERLWDTASNGVVWSGAVFSLIDNVIRRSPVIWTNGGDPYETLSPDDQYQ